MPRKRRSTGPGTADFCCTPCTTHHWTICGSTASPVSCQCRGGSASSGNHSIPVGRFFARPFFASSRRAPRSRNSFTSAPSASSAAMRTPLTLSCFSFRTAAFSGSIADGSPILPSHSAAAARTACRPSASATTTFAALSGTVASAACAIGRSVLLSPRAMSHSRGMKPGGRVGNMPRTLKAFSRCGGEPLPGLRTACRKCGCSANSGQTASGSQSQKLCQRLLLR